MGRGAEISRRDFPRALVGLAASGASLILLLKHHSPLSADTPDKIVVDLANRDFGALRQIGGAVKIALPGQADPIIVTRIDDTTYAAFSSSCTHQGCEVLLPDGDGVIQCPCHGSSFDMRGRVMGGPAPIDLPSFPVEVKQTNTAVKEASWGQVKKTGKL